MGLITNFCILYFYHWLESSLHWFDSRNTAFICVEKQRSISK